MTASPSKPAAFWTGLLSGFLAALLVLGAASVAAAHWPPHPEQASVLSGAAVQTNLRLAGPPPLALRLGAEHLLYLPLIMH